MHRLDQSCPALALLWSVFWNRRDIRIILIPKWRTSTIITNLDRSFLRKLMNIQILVVNIRRRWWIKILKKKIWRKQFFFFVSIHAERINEEQFLGLSVRASSRGEWCKDARILPGPRQLFLRTRPRWTLDLRHEHHYALHEYLRSWCRENGTE